MTLTYHRSLCPADFSFLEGSKWMPSSLSWLPTSTSYRCFQFSANSPSCSATAPGDLEVQGGLTPKEGSIDCPYSRHADGRAGNSLHRDLSETKVTPREHSGGGGEGGVVVVGGWWMIAIWAHFCIDLSAVIYLCRNKDGFDYKGLLYSLIQSLRLQRCRDE